MSRVHATCTFQSENEDRLTCCLRIACAQHAMLLFSDIRYGRTLIVFSSYLAPHRQQICELMADLLSVADADLLTDLWTDCGAKCLSSAHCCRPAGTNLGH